MKNFTITQEQATVLVNKLFEILERKYNVKITRHKKSEN